MPASKTSSQTTAAKTAPEAFKWPKAIKTLVLDYLKARVSSDADAPHRGLPFITEKDVLRIKPSDWIEWLHTEGMKPSKTEALKGLKDAGFVQRVYPLPKVDGQAELEGKSFGLYTGPAPQGASKLPRRIVERVTPTPAAEPAAAAAAAPEAPAKPRARSAKAKVAEISGAMAEDADTDPTRGPVEPAPTAA
jgi:hypothetical protein